MIKSFMGNGGKEKGGWEKGGMAAEVPPPCQGSRDVRPLTRKGKKKGGEGKENWTGGFSSTAASRSYWKHVFQKRREPKNKTERREKKEGIKKKKTEGGGKEDDHSPYRAMCGDF